MKIFIFEDDPHRVTLFRDYWGQDHEIDVTQDYKEAPYCWLKEEECLDLVG